MKLRAAIVAATLLGLSGPAAFASPGPALYAGWTSLYQQAQEQKEVPPPPIPAPQQQSSMQDDLTTTAPSERAKPRHTAPAKTR